MNIFLIQISIMKTIWAEQETRYNAEMSRDLRESVTRLTWTKVPGYPSHLPIYTWSILYYLYH